MALLPVARQEHRLADATRRPCTRHPVTPRQAVRTPYGSHCENAMSRTRQAPIVPVRGLPPGAGSLLYPWHKGPAGGISVMKPLEMPVADQGFRAGSGLSAGALHVRLAAIDGTLPVCDTPQRRSLPGDPGPSFPAGNCTSARGPSRTRCGWPGRRGHRLSACLRESVMRRTSTPETLARDRVDG
jgi:hypothetical protein